MRDQSIKSRVYESILKDILEGVYGINSVINEKALVEKYNVSKTPVREALVQLCSEGILKNIPRFGYQLAMFTPDEILEVLEYRTILEVSALELCFHKLTEENINELKELNRMDAEIIYRHDTKIHWDRNQEFHKRLCSFCDNRYIQKSMNDILNTCTRISNQYFTKLWDQGEQSNGSNHVLLVQAIEDGDLEKAKEILAEDVGAFKKVFL